jgi:alpha-1,4-galacturonosyltransferase
MCLKKKFSIMSTNKDDLDYSNNLSSCILQDLREVRHVKRLTELTKNDAAQSKKLEAAAISSRAKQVDNGSVGSFSVWRPQGLSTSSDTNVRIMRDQLIMARAYANMAMTHNDARLLRDLKYRIRENTKVLEDVTVDSQLPRG